MYIFGKSGLIQFCWIVAKFCVGYQSQLFLPQSERRPSKIRLPVPLSPKNRHSSTKELIALPATLQQRRQQLQTDQVAQKISNYR